MSILTRKYKNWTKWQLHENFFRKLKSTLTSKKRTGKKFAVSNKMKTDYRNLSKSQVTLQKSVHSCCTDIYFRRVLTKNTYTLGSKKIRHPRQFRGPRISPRGSARTMLTSAVAPLPLSLTLLHTKERIIFFFIFVRI